MILVFLNLEFLLVQIWGIAEAVKSVQSYVHFISWNYGPFIYLSAVLFKKGCIFRQEPEQWHLGRLVAISELWSISSQNECKTILQEVPSLFLVPQLCHCWFSLSPRSQKGPGRNCRPCLHWIPFSHPVLHDQSTAAAQPQALLDYTGHWHFTQFLNLGHLPCPINFHKAELHYEALKTQIPTLVSSWPLLIFFLLPLAVSSEP